MELTLNTGILRRQAWMLLWHLGYLQPLNSES